MNDFQKLEQKRLALMAEIKEGRKRALFPLIPGIVMIAIGALTQIPILLVIGIVATVIGLIMLAIAYKGVAAYNKSIKNNLITVLLKDAYEDVVYDQNRGIPLAQILKTDTVKRPDRYTMEDYFSATYKGVKFETSDLDLKERVERRDSKGNVHVSYETYFKGRWITYYFERHFKEGLKIIESRFGFNKRGFEKMDTESIEFNKKFTIYTTSKQYGFYQITSSMIEKLLKLEKMHKGQIVYCFMDNQLHIGINDRKDYLEVSYKTPITEEGLKSTVDDIELIAAVINEFRLDSQKFKKQ